MLLEANPCTETSGPSSSFSDGKSIRLTLKIDLYKIGMYESDTRVSLDALLGPIMRDQGISFDTERRFRSEQSTLPSLPVIVHQPWLGVSNN